MKNIFLFIAFFIASATLSAQNSESEKLRFTLVFESGQIITLENEKQSLPKFTKNITAIGIDGSSLKDYSFNIVLIDNKKVMPVLAYPIDFTKEMNQIPFAQVNEYISKMDVGDTIIITIKDRKNNTDVAPVLITFE
jgi:hypothetical protein